MSRYLWDWYFELAARIAPRIRDGVCYSIPPTEFQAWKAARGLIVHGWEYAILCAMDDAYCVEMGKELAAFREREEERRVLEAEKAKRGRRG